MSRLDKISRVPARHWGVPASDSIIREASHVHQNGYCLGVIVWLVPSDPGPYLAYMRHESKQIESLSRDCWHSRWMWLKKGKIDESFARLEIECITCFDGFTELQSAYSLTRAPETAQKRSTVHLGDCAVSERAGVRLDAGLRRLLSPSGPPAGKVARKQSQVCSCDVMQKLALTHFSRLPILLSCHVQITAPSHRSTRLQKNIRTTVTQDEAYLTLNTTRRELPYHSHGRRTSLQIDRKRLLR